jgi:3-hydroxyisobutyrate dehydrogenase
MAIDGERAGFIGLGLMGRPMALRLLRAGYRLAVWGRQPGRLGDLVKAGANTCDTPSRLAAESDVVLLCVSDTAALREVVDAPHGLAAGLSAGKLVIDLSTVDVEATREIAARLRRDRGAHWVDAPVSGGPAAAAAGTLAVMAGADEAVFERARVVLGHLAARVTLMGPVGAGQTTKLVNQVIVGGCKTVIAEAVQLAINLGLDPLRLPEAFDGGRADSLLLRQSLPKMAGNDFSASTSHLRTIAKDLDMVTAAARATGTPMPMTAHSAEMHRIMLAHGHAEADTTAVIALLRDRPIF